MNERTPKSTEFQPESFNRRIKDFVDAVVRTSEIEHKPGSEDNIAWVRTNLKSAVVQRTLEESELKGLLVPESFFRSSHVRPDAFKKVQMRVRSKEWQTTHIGGENGEAPGETNWEAGITIKLRYEGKNKLVARQLFSVTANSEQVNEAPEIKRTFDPSEADGEELDEFGGRTFVLSENRSPISSEDRFKTVEGTPEQVVTLLGLAQEIYNRRKHD